VVYREHYEKHKALFMKRADTFHAAVRELMRNAKAKPCADCGQSFRYYVMQFDHRVDETKCFNIADAMGPKRVGKARLLAEIAKCDVVCANCHCERTHRRRKIAARKKKATAES
jgi:hypothetical protein